MSEISAEAREALMSFEWPDFGPDIAKAAGKPDWTYRDQSWMRSSDWEQFIDIAGEENIALLAATAKGDLMRGQFLISPEGIERVKRHSLGKSPS